MATLASPDSPSPPRAFRRRTKSFARKCERCCCAVATCFPLAFVYGVTTWAAWVEISMGLTPSKNAWTGLGTSFIGAVVYVLLNASYTVAVFTDPGSPVDTPASRISKHGYSHLPTTEPRAHVDPSITSVTVSSTGAPRFCKKCLSPKPDRAHHCSTCKRCVLKMDHHCPWLATCVGLHNYKAFLLFLIYTSLFCWICLAVTSQWIWAEVLSDQQYLETLMPINVVLLAVIAGIVGLVLTGFTIWHVSLAYRGITTIECLEKTRYLSPLRKAHQQQLLRQQQPSSEEDVGPRSSRDIPGIISNSLHKAGEELLTIHANAIPGATRLEEGEEHFSSSTTHRPYDDPEENHSYPQYHPSASSDSSPQSPQSRAQASLTRNLNYHHRSPASREASEERRRYQEYLDEEYAPKLPHAFDLGWKQNLIHLFGPKPWLWWLPISNTTGDGWRWEVSERWLKAREEVAEERRREEARLGLGGPRRNHHHQHPRRLGYEDDNYSYYEQDRSYNHSSQPPPPPQSRIKPNPDYYSHSSDYRRNSEAGSGLSMHTLDPQQQQQSQKQPPPFASTTAPDNFIPFLTTTNRTPKPKKSQNKLDFNVSDDGEVMSFMVSGSEGEESDSNSSSDDEAENHGHKNYSIPRNHLSEQEDEVEQQRGRTGPAATGEEAKGDEEEPETGTEPADEWTRW